MTKSLPTPDMIRFRRMEELVQAIDQMRENRQVGPGEFASVLLTCILKQARERNHDLDTVLEWLVTSVKIWKHVMPPIPPTHETMQ